MVHKDAGHDSRIQLAGNRDPVRLDSQIAAVERWIPTAATALLDFYDDGVFAEGGARFWRSNIERRQAQNSSDVNQRRKAKGATSTTRSLFALLLLVRLLEQEPELRETLWTAPASDRLKQVLTHAATHYFPQALVDLRTNSENYENRFTDAHILSAFALLLQSPALSDCLFPEQRIQISEEACGLARPIRAQVEANGGAALRTDERVHDFVTLH
ncbi:MAG: hypothetical protein QOI20_2779, partial [Acidimicrobiaceae bacterium]|nr:hypothetical protein [Acidimicrobiaceae bacterium]